MAVAGFGVESEEMGDPFLISDEDFTLFDASLTK